MSFKVKLFSLEHEWSSPEKIGPIIAKEGESYANLRIRLEDADVVDWPFLFWDVEDKVKINMKLEKLNTILPEMYVIPMESEDVDVYKRRRVGGESFVIKSTPSEATEVQGVVFQDGVEDIPVNLAACSRVSSSESRSLLKSLLIPKEVMELYFKGEEKLRNELKQISLEDHNWSLKSWDQDGVGVLKVYYE